MYEIKPRMTMDTAARAKRILDASPDWQRLNSMSIGPFTVSRKGIENAEKAYCKSLARADVCRHMSKLFIEARDLRTSFLAMERLYRAEAQNNLETKQVLIDALENNRNLFDL